MKIVKAGVYAVLRFLGFIAVPLYLVHIIDSNFPGVLPYTFEHLEMIFFVVGIPLIAFYFLAEALKNWKLKLLFEFIAITLVLLWTYFVLGGGKMSISYEGLNLHIDYYPLLILLLLGIALRYPASAMKHYLEYRSEPQR